MHQTLDFISEPLVEHNPDVKGLTLVAGRVYKNKDGALFVRLPQREIPKYHRTGRPAVGVSYVGVPTEFTAEDLSIILKAMS